MNFRVSIIIPTYKRIESLMRLLHSLKNALQVNDEIIVVEQGEPHREEIQRVLKRISKHYHYIYESLPSPSHAKNIGLKHASGDVVLFFDDDVVPFKNIIEAHMRNYTDSRIGGVCGRCITVGQTPEPQRQHVGRISWIGGFSDGYSSTIRQEIDTVIGCNASFRRSLIADIGGFDEQFTGNAMREESDLSLRVKARGYSIVFDPKAQVTHMREESGGARKIEGRMEWYFHFFSNETYFFLKHRTPWLLPAFLFTRGEWALRCMFGFGREVSYRSMVTPIRGVFDGIRKFTRYYEHRY